VSEASSYGQHVSYRIFCSKCYREIKDGEIVVWDVSNTASIKSVKYYHIWCYNEVW